jgi:hypothetical protein
MRVERLMRAAGLSDLVRRRRARMTIAFPVSASLTTLVGCDFNPQEPTGCGSPKLSATRRSRIVRW